MSGAFLAQAKESWNGAPPDWVVALAAACDREPQRKVAVRIGFSHTVISQLIRNSYPRGTAKVEAAVRGALMAQTVECPVLGQIGSQNCIQAQGRRPDFLGANPEHFRLYRACRGGCPHSFLKGKTDDDD